jgi:hypothetical protein
MALITRKQAAAKVTDALAAEDVSILALARTSTSWIMTERTELTVAIPRDSSGGLPEDTIVKINLENRELSDAQATEMRNLVEKRIVSLAQGARLDRGN